MRRSFKVVSFFVVAVSAAFFGVCQAISAPAGPMSVIKNGTDRALNMIKDSQEGRGPKLSQQKGEVLRIIDEYFNFEEMAKRSLGRPWKDLSPERRTEFVGLFKQLLFTTYIGKIEGYTGSRDQITYDSEKIDGEFAVGKTRVLNYKNSDIQIDYRLNLLDGNWKVYDLVVEGISYVDNYRAQFASILANQSFDVLLKKMREKAQSS